jgi:hypothetical protein
MEFRSPSSMELTSLCSVLGWIALHGLALVSAWGTRVAADPRIELAVQCCFLAAMAAVGGAAWICHQRELGLWLPSAMTLVAMTLTAVTGLRQTCESAPASRRPAGR